MAAHPASADTTTTAASSAVVTPADEATTDIAAGPVASPPAQADIAADSPAPSAAATDTDNTPADAAGTDPATAVESAAVVPASEAPPASAPAEASRASGHPASPSFLQRRRSARPSPSPARWQWAVVVVLATLLVLQVLLADRERLAADAAWRPLIGGLCGVLGCSMPAWREPQALTMINRDVRPLPQVPGVLLAKATFRNDARWAQPWPVLLLTLKDADGRSLGARALLPADYLDAAASADIAPGQTAEITVRVREPSASVVAFAFDFH
ncbi:hypothetical protein ABB29_02145 [Pseudoxanthomonas dokdonensis]|uniref:DUF3426 domain-containing protein n=2 Tax=Pseudoxanthomonas dokdonensis TaxID=344882 RepID=A0A0R0CPB6_9GAMM|nr:hypothetical protein ABB29_02145 [Pseudoxanthomonas dokdonensis]